MLPYTYLHNYPIINACYVELLYVRVWCACVLGCMRVRVCVRAYVRACVRASVRARVCVCACVCTRHQSPARTLTTYRASENISCYIDDLGDNTVPVPQVSVVGIIGERG